MDEKNVHYNKLGITERDRLKREEYRLTSQRTKEILEQGALGPASRYDFERLKAVHHYLFQDVYEWAGKVRTIGFSKRLDSRTVSVFANPATFDEQWRALEQKTAAFVAAKNLTHGQKVDALVEIFIEANHIHPFPEGNGRSLQVFMRQLAREQGVDLDYGKTNAQEWNRASAISGKHGEPFEQEGRKFLAVRPPERGAISGIFAEMASPTLNAYAKGKQAAAGGVSPGGQNNPAPAAERSAGPPRGRAR